MKIRNLLNKLDSISKNLSWSSLDEGLSMEDKMTIFEEFYTTGNLTESTDIDKKDYFVSLFDLSIAPTKGKKYIVVPLSLVSNKIVQLDKPAISEFVSQNADGLTFNTSQGEKTYPSKTMRDLSIFNTFTFSSTNTYNKFRTALLLKFNTLLPDIKAFDQNIAEGERFDHPLSGYRIVYRESGNVVLNTPQVRHKRRSSEVFDNKDVY